MHRASPVENVPHIQLPDIAVLVVQNGITGDLGIGDDRTYRS